MSAVVVDASVALAWAFDDETTAYTENVMDAARTMELVAPAIWPFEVANVLAIAEKRGRITRDGAADHVAMLMRLPVRVSPLDVSGVLERVREIAVDHGLSVYDAAYLDLARSLGAPLASLDARLLRATVAAGATPWEPEGP